MIPAMTNLGLKLVQFCLGDGVRLGDDRNQIDFTLQLLHRHQVERLESAVNNVSKVTMAAIHIGVGWSEVSNAI